MANKLTGYNVFKSSGGNTCVCCGTRMRKELPYLAPISGKRVIREMRGKAICVSCVRDMNNLIDSKLSELDPKELETYERRRFLEHMDKESKDV